MNDYKMPIIEPTIDYTKVPPINQKRTITFINHFVVHIVVFLNKFALSCEERLCEFENKLQRIEASLEILESWLSSVPMPEQNERIASEENAVQNSDIAEKETSTPKIDEPTANEEPRANQTEEQPSNKDPRYEKYFKMLHFGVAKGAVKIQIEQEGLDPSVLDDPRLIISKPKDNGESEGN